MDICLRVELLNDKFYVIYISVVGYRQPSVNMKIQHLYIYVCVFGYLSN